MGKIICTFAPYNELEKLYYNHNKPVSVKVCYIRHLFNLERDIGSRYSPAEYLGNLKDLQFEYDYVVIRVCQTTLRLLCRSNLDFYINISEKYLENIMTSTYDLYQYGSIIDRKRYCDEIRQLVRAYKKKSNIKIRHESSVEECINNLEKRKFWKRNKIKLQMENK